MTRARKDLIDTTRAGTYHLITRCVRRERLLDRGERKVWLCRGLANWLSHMGIDLLAYAVMGTRHNEVGHWNEISALNGWPAHAAVNASPTTLRAACAGFLVEPADA